MKWLKKFNDPKYAETFYTSSVSVGIQAVAASSSSVSVGILAVAVSSSAEVQVGGASDHVAVGVQTGETAVCCKEVQTSHEHPVTFRDIGVQVR